MFWIKCRRLLRSPTSPGKRKLLIALFAIAVYVVVSYLVYSYHSGRSYNLKLSTLRKKLLHYCNPAGPPLGFEHNEPMEYAQFKLKQVQVVVRHGDRSAIAKDLLNMTHFNCDLKSQNSQHAQKLDMLKKTEKFLKTVNEYGKEEVIRDFLLPENRICELGQLTGKGYLQLLYLGEYIMNLYGRRLDINIASFEEDEVMAFATYIERTQQSAAAFLAGMLEKLYNLNISDKVSKNYPAAKIRVSKDIYFREDENNEIPACFELNRIMQGRDSREFQNGMSSFQPLMERLSQIFNVPKRKLPKLRDVFDLVTTHHCHHHPPPCGPKACIDDAVKMELLKTVDWVIKTQYKPTATFLTHPLLSKIAQRMLGQALGERQTKFVLFATHDSTVVPLLIEMGIFQDHWPAFASRVVFELWEAGGLLGSKLAGETVDKHFIRVLYDGHDFTKKLKFCKGELKFGKLCPLKAFIKALEGTSGSMDVQYSKLCSESTVENKI